MKTKSVNYDDIISIYNGEEFNHGHIVYNNYRSSTDVDLLNLKIDIELCIFLNAQEDFLKDISELVNKYAW